MPVGQLQHRNLQEEYLTIYKVAVLTQKCKHIIIIILAVPVFRIQKKSLWLCRGGHGSRIFVNGEIVGCTVKHTVQLN